MNQTELSIEQKLSLAQSFSNHPIQNETLDYKIKYINVLEWFVNKFASDDIFASQLLANYKTGLLGSQVSSYQYSDDIENLLNVAAKLRLQHWHWFSYRYLLLVDLLFLCAFRDAAKANLVVEEYKKHLKLWFYKNRYFKNMNELTAELYSVVKSDLQLDAVKEAVINWQKNVEFITQKPLKILVTANMSAGKSTLINALAGKQIVRTQNMACTSKLHYIYNKAFEDGFNYKIDGSVSLNADRENLWNNAEANTTNVVLASTYFRSLCDNKPLCLIDTPGVNYSGNSNHKTITQQAVLQKNYDKLVYVMNAEYLGTTDEYEYLKFIADNVKDKEILIVINKLDTFNVKEDCIAESIKSVFDDINKVHINNFRLCPVSAYAGLLAKEKIWDDSLDEFDMDDLEVFRRKMKKDEYNLQLYYNNEEVVDKGIEFPDSYRKYIKLLSNCGISPFEKIIFE